MEFQNQLSRFLKQRRAIIHEPLRFLICSLIIGLSVRSVTADDARPSRADEARPSRGRSTLSPMGTDGENNRTINRCTEFDKGIVGEERTAEQRFEDIGAFAKGPGCGETPVTCPHCAGPACCSAEVELRLMARSRLEFDAVVAKKMNIHRQIFVTSSNKFEAFCVQLMDKSKRNLYDMFTRTYGQLFQQNSQIFIQFYRDLTGFYKGQTDRDLGDSIDQFFSALFQRMFEMLNSQHSFSEQYFSCVTEHLSLLKPFGDVPSKLSAQIKRSFTAARTFFQALAIGRDVIQSMSKQELTSPCHNRIVRMLHCRHCNGVMTDDNKPCYSYCTDVSHGCLSYHAQLNDIWNTYIEELLKLSQRLAGPFNMERVVDPLDVTISDAIMNYQENSASISELVFQGCGQPAYGKHVKTKRNALNQSTTSNAESDAKLRTRSASSAAEFERILREARNKLEPLTNIWEELSGVVCKELATNDTNNCWNVRRRSLIGRSGESLANTSRERVAAEENRSSIVELSVVRLNLIIGRLKIAYSGNKVDWADTDDAEVSGSGQFESSGSETEESPAKINPSEDISFTTDRPTVRPIVVVTRSPQTFSNRSERRTLDISFMLFLCLTTIILKA